MKVVVAIGGNALISRDHESILDQLEVVESLAPALVDIVQSGHQLVVTHGNGPQVGYILRRSELAIEEVAPVPIDFAVADTQGAIGHMFLLAIRNELRRRQLDRDVAALITEVQVDRHDRAFASPAKPIGSFFDEATATSLARRLDWTVAEDSGRGWRRVVASPVPVSVTETSAIDTLLTANTVVIAGGGGGIPVAADANGEMRRVEAVVDKDYTSALIADGIDADRLVLVTSIDQVATGFGTAHQRWLDSITAHQARELLTSGEFGAGSMAPKVEAALRFVDGRASRVAVITSVTKLGAAVEGGTGTHITGL